MSPTPGEFIKAFAGEIGMRDVRRLEAFLDEEVVARFDEVGDLRGRRALLGFWRRLFQSYPLFELHILRSVTEQDLVIAEAIYLIGQKGGGVMSIRAITVFEIRNNVVVRWEDHADLAGVPWKERQRWRRLGGSRW